MKCPWQSHSPGSTVAARRAVTPPRPPPSRLRRVHPGVRRAQSGAHQRRLPSLSRSGFYLEVCGLIFEDEDERPRLGPAHSGRSGAATSRPADVGRPARWSQRIRSPEYPPAPAVPSCPGVQRCNHETASPNRQARVASAWQTLAAASTPPGPARSRPSRRRRAATGGSSWPPRCPRRPEFPPCARSPPARARQSCHTLEARRKKQTEPRARGGSVGQSAQPGGASISRTWFPDGPGGRQAC